MQPPQPNTSSSAFNIQRRARLCQLAGSAASLAEVARRPADHKLKVVGADATPATNKSPQSIDAGRQM